MGDEKRNKIVAAITVNAVLFVFIILAVLIAQIVQISVLKRRKRVLLGKLQTYYAQQDKSEDIFERLENDSEYQNMVIQLRQMGMTEQEIVDYLLRNDPEQSANAAPVLAIIFE